MQWDVFCRVIDNYGDIGVCWRLAADLGARGQAVRLWVDDPSALSWMAPEGAPNVRWAPWPGDDSAPEPADVVIEAFGCDPPASFVQRMAARATPPWWINLEYLSAEAYVQRSHGLRSPQLSGPGRGLEKWFFYPGFTAATGGLLREAGLLQARQRFDRVAWLRSRGIALQPGEQVLSLFCYEDAPVASLLKALAGRPALLLRTPGAAARAWQAAGGDAACPPGVRSLELPWLPQTEFDHLLWACDLNFVRGEDSFVRAQWAGAPFVWQIYPQQDRAHAAKLQAFLDLFLHGADAALTRSLPPLWQAWNGLAQGPLVLPDHPSWAAQALRWRTLLLAQPDLASQLIGFVAGKR